MKTSSGEHNDRNAAKGVRPFPGLLDLSLAFDKRNLKASGFPQRAIAYLDRYSRFKRIEPELLSFSHRWTEEDIGKTFVGYEVPKGSPRGVVFEVILTSTIGRSFVSFEVSDAYDLTFLANEGWSVRKLGPFLKDEQFAVDAESLVSLEFIDRDCELLADDGELHDRFRLFMAIQDWALQPI
jgi:hypothetical protein